MSYLVYMCQLIFVACRQCASMRVCVRGYECVVIVLLVYKKKCSNGLFEKEACVFIVLCTID